MSVVPVYSLNYFKNAASRLLKDARRADGVAKRRALKRFTQLQTLEKIESADQLQHKHALAVVATEAGFPSWLALRRSFQQASQINYSDFFGAPRFDGSLKHWFSDYPSARQYLQEKGGYLFPFRQQFFVASFGYINSLGLEPGDADWQLIGFDWVEPSDEAAKQRLMAKLERLYCRH